MVLPLALTAHHARCSASCSAHRRHGSLCTYSTRLYARFAHAAPPDRPSPPPPCFSRIRPWPISRFAASRGPCCHCSMCFRGAFGIHTQVFKLWVATTASILRVLVGCTHVLWLAQYMVTNSVRCGCCRGPPRAIWRPGWLVGMLLAAPGTMWRPEMAVRASATRVWWPWYNCGIMQATLCNKKPQGFACSHFRKTTRIQPLLTV